MDIEKFIKKLEAEIKSGKEEIDQAASLIRLQAAAERYRGDDEVVTFDQIYNRIKDRPEVKKYKTGFSGLDSLLRGGFRKKRLFVLSAIHKHGKTSLCLYWTKVLKEMNPMWIPLEQPAEELVEQLIEKGHEIPKGHAPNMNKGNTLEWIEQKIIEVLQNTIAAQSSLTTWGI